MRNILMTAGALSLGLALPAAAQFPTAAPSAGSPGGLPSANAGVVFAPGSQERRGPDGAPHRRRGKSHGPHNHPARSATDSGHEAAAVGASQRTELDSMDSTALRGLGSGAARLGGVAGAPASPMRGMTSPFPRGPNTAGPWSGR